MDNTTKYVFNADSPDPFEEMNRNYTPEDDDIDWDEIIATTEDDFLAGRYSFNSADYATEEEAKAAMWEWMKGIWEEAFREAAAGRSFDAPR